ncbi:MAG: MBL fold metallo-hydrolase [Brevundimonas sp.]
MADGVVLPDDRPGAGGDRGLIYPFPTPPGVGEAVEVAPGVLWLRLPLPMVLDHINVYALEDGDGWTLVDTGLNTPDSIAAWEAALAGPLGGRPVTRVICTHMHPDHIGLASWLCERFAAPLLMSRLEYVTARMLIADTGLPAPEDGTVFYRAAGWDEEQIAGYRKHFGGFGKAVRPLPTAFTRLSEGDVLTIGDGSWRVVIGEGHSPEHACLWREADGVLLAGDQILPRISSIVAVWPTEPAADPLGDWLVSLERLKTVFADDTLVLPSHGKPFRGVQTRLDALIRGHQVGLQRLLRTLAVPSRAVDVFGALFARTIGKGLLGMATGESLAHLNYLVRDGRAQVARDADGVDWWTTTSSSET